MNKIFDVIIVGSGGVGSLFALQLGVLRPDFNILLLDDKAYNDFDYNSIDNRIFAISNYNYQKLSDLGVWPQKRFAVISKMDIHTGFDTNLVLDANLNIDELSLARTIEQKVLLDLIRQKLLSLNNVTIVVDSISDIKYLDDYISLSTCSCQHKSYLLVGADGGNSFIRDYFQLNTKSYDYNRFGVVANFSHSKNHNNIAHQWFKDDKILAYLPCYDANISSIVLSTKDIAHITNMDGNDFGEYVSVLGDFTLGKMSLISKVHSYPLRLNIVHNTFKKNLVLIGDAAHTIHPLAGLGINLGFADVFKLAKYLSSVVEKSNLGNIAVLHKYSLSRINDVLKTQLLCHGLFKFYAIDNIALKFIGDFGVRVIENSSYLKKFIINGINKFI